MRITYIHAQRALKVVKSPSSNLDLTFFFADIWQSAIIHSSLNYLTWISTCQRVSFKISNFISGFRSQSSRYDAIPYVKRLRRLETQTSGAHETSTLRCVSHPHANYLHTVNARRHSLRPNGITDIIVRGEKEGNAPASREYGRTRASYSW